MSYPGGFSLDGRFVHNGSRDSNSDCGRLLGSISASQRYKVRLYRIKTHQVDILGECTTLAEFYSIEDSSATTARIRNLFSWRLLGPVVATQRYKIRLYRMNTHGATGLAISNTRQLIPPQP